MPNIFPQETLQPGWASYLMSAYYPLLMTCASLVVCLWAEVSYLFYSNPNGLNLEHFNYHYFNRLVDSQLIFKYSCTCTLFAGSIIYDANIMIIS